MSTLVTSARQSIAAHWLLAAIATIVVAAALVGSLLATFNGSSSASNSGVSVGGAGTNLVDNSCHAVRFGPC